MKNVEDFANSHVTFDDVGDNIRMPVLDSFYSSGRHNNFNIISVGHTVTNLIVKARENKTIAHIYSLKEYNRSFKLIVIYRDLNFINMV